MVWTTILGYHVEASGATALTSLLLTLTLLACAGLGASGFLAWKFVIQPKRSAKLAAPVSEPGQAGSA